MKKAALVMIAIAVSVAGLGIYVYHAGKMKENIEFKDSLSKVAVTVDANQLTIQDMAFYVAYEEKTVEDQALIYNEDNTNAYWNLHINGEFMKVTARNAAMNMAVHDEIFYEMAVAEGTELNEEETALLEGKESDFIMDLPDGALQRLGVTQEEIYGVMHKMAISQKYQDYYAATQGRECEDYDFEGEAYLALLEKHTVEINEESWNRLDFGNITLDHSK